MKRSVNFRRFLVVLLLCLSVLAGGCMLPMTGQSAPSLAASAASGTGSSLDQAASGSSEAAIPETVEKLSKERSVTLAEAPKTRTTKPAGLTVDQFIAELVRLTNDERAKAGLPALQTSDASLFTAAGIRAKELAVKFDHIRPNGTFFTSVLTDCGVYFSAAGENILYASSGLSPASVIQAWMASAGHRANILSTTFTHIGIGYYRSSRYDYFAQLFTRNP